jgi:hypothetical protein
MNTAIAVRLFVLQSNYAVLITLHIHWLASKKEPLL